MNILERLHMLQRIWRYRLASEKDSVAYLLEQDLEGATVLDIGANRGIYTYWMSKKVRKNGRVIAFEPQPELGDFLLDLKASFKLTNVMIQNKGLSDKAGNVNLVRGKIGSGGARLEQENDPLSQRAGLQKISVTLTTLDDFFKETAPEKLSFIKCDVEGHELPALKGGELTLKKYMPTILFECHDREAKEGTLFSFLAGLGYTGFFIQNGKKIHYKNYDRYPYSKVTFNYRNYIFTTKERAGRLAD